MGFYLEKYNENYASLIVTFQGGDINNASYFSGDSVQDAMNYFDVYLDDSSSLRIHTKESKIIEEIGVDSETVEEFKEKMSELTSALDDEQAKDKAILFNNWKVDKAYKKNDRVRLNGKGLYKCLQDHTSQRDWAPGLAPSLWAAMLTDPESTDIPQWTQPDSTNGYSVGDQVIFEGETYESLIDNNVWSPTAYPTGWKKVTEEPENGDNDNVPSPEPEPEPETPTYPEWVQPGAANPYKAGDIVTYKGNVYRSNIDGNVWSPEAYPAGWTQI